MSDSIIPDKKGWEYPAFDVAWEREKRSRWMVAIFVINEGAKIQKQLHRMKSLVDLVDIVVADGGSTDDSLTSELMQECGARAWLVKRGAGKLSAQMRMALVYAMRQGYDGVITIDGNGKDGIEAIPEFVRRLEAGADHIQGSRFIAGGHHAHTPFSRLLGLRLLHAPLISWAAKFPYTDTTNGFRGYSRRFLLDPRLLPFRHIFSAYELHYYLAIRAARLGFRVEEAPVSRVYPATGKVPTKISPIRGNLLVLRTLFAAVMGRFDPPRSSS